MESLGERFRAFQSVSERRRVARELSSRSSLPGVLLLLLLQVLAKALPKAPAEVFW